MSMDIEEENILTVSENKSRNFEINKRKKADKILYNTNKKQSTMMPFGENKTIKKVAQPQSNFNNEWKHRIEKNVYRREEIGSDQ